MKEFSLQIITVLYAGVGLVALIAFWPTIKDLYIHKKASANISSYVLWTSTGFISFLYSLFILPDLLFRVVSGINFFACLLVLILSIRLQKNK